MAEPHSEVLETNKNALSKEPAEEFPIDDNVLATFPPGTQIVSAIGYARSHWANIGYLNIIFPDDLKSSFFTESVAGERARTMMEGEFNGLTEIRKTMPSLVPKPHSWGKYKIGNPDTYFLLEEFIEMDKEICLPDPDQLCSRLAELHKNSISPTGKFGFHITTCQGQIPQMTGTWEARWEDLFVKILKHVVVLDFERNGPWTELDILERRIFSRVVPRLIGNLERDGRSVKPSLIHGDLWEGNIGTSSKTGEVFMFDCGAFYAHNEMEIGDWRCKYNKIHEEIYTRTYKRYYDPSEPQEEWDDRNRMYCIYYNVFFSANHLTEGKAVRQT